VLLQIVDWFYVRVMLGQQPEDTLWVVVISIIQTIGVELAIHFAYQVVSWPIYWVGMMRYAITHDWKVFIDLRKNLSLGINEEFSDFLELLLIFLGINAALAVGSTAFAASVIGIPLIPLISVPLGLNGAEAAPGAKDRVST
jgi:hypothetical protein